MFVRMLAMLMLSAAAFCLAAGCSQGSSAAAVGASPDNAQASAATASGKSGAELWAENCSRCHNFRPPPSFSDAQWHAIVHHMRQRANLTGEEARAITVFLQSANQ